MSLNTEPITDIPLEQPDMPDYDLHTSSSINLDNITNMDVAPNVDPVPSLYDVDVAPSMPDVYVAPSMPDVDVAPSMPGVDVAPSMPDVDVVPSMPDVYVAPSMPGVDVAPSMPDVDVAPSMPGVDVAPSMPGVDVAPSMPGVDVAPSMPDVDVVPTFPDVTPSMPDVDVAPTMPDVDVAPTMPGMDVMSSIPSTENIVDSVTNITPNLDIQSFIQQPVDEETIISKIKKSFVRVYNIMFTYDTLMIMLVTCIILLILTIYNVYKNKMLTIEIKEKINRTEKKIQKVFTNIYEYIKDTIRDVYYKLKYLIFKKEVEEDEDKKVEDEKVEDEKVEDKKTMNIPGKIAQQLNTVIKEEVFNISENIFTFDEAEGVCKAFDSELASKEQIELALEDGANWCNYGWSKGGLALYPIQEGYYKRLKKSDSKKKNQCGFPGVNGGKLNPNLKLGVNCYGKKPVDKIDSDNKCNISEKKTDISNLYVNKFNCSNDSQFD